MSAWKRGTSQKHLTQIQIVDAAVKKIGKNRARRRNMSGRRLTPEQIVNAAVKIIGEGRARRADVRAIVDHMTMLSELSKRKRSSESKNQTRFAKQCSAALRMVIAMIRQAPTDFRPPQPLLRVSVRAYAN